jgi:hypothetical protein
MESKPDESVTVSSDSFNGNEQHVERCEWVLGLAVIDFDLELGQSKSSKIQQTVLAS